MEKTKLHSNGNVTQSRAIHAKDISSAATATAEKHWHQMKPLFAAAIACAHRQCALSVLMRLKSKTPGYVTNVRSNAID
jgi:hypothetical protein